MAEAGHDFLAKLGKKRLRPGGKLATDWLIEQGQFGPDKLVIEVACNMATTSIELAQKYGCHIEAIDMDRQALQKASDNVTKAGLDQLIHLQAANAMKLPFDDQSFDIIINEAMLTMQADKAKEKCLAEYFRVLKPGGILLTHDVRLVHEDEAVRQSLSKAINVNVSPLTEEGWTALAKGQGFKEVTTKTGTMTLLTLSGLIYDEGLWNALSIAYKGMKKANRAMFWKMYQTFRKNDDQLGYIAMASRKGDLG